MKTFLRIVLAFSGAVCALFGLYGVYADLTGTVPESMSAAIFALICASLLFILAARIGRKKDKAIERETSSDIALKVVRDGNTFNIASDSKGDSWVTPIASVEYHHIDPDENVPAPPGSALSYLDAQALKFWSGKQTDFVIPSYYKDTAFGRNVKPALDRLLADGYLDYGGIDRNIELKTVPDIKAVLADKGLRVSGKKSELVQRLLDNVDPYELEALFPVGVYVITPKGDAALEPYSIIEANDRHALRIPYYKLMAERSSHPGENDNDILKRILLSEIDSRLQVGDEAGYQESLTTLGRFLREIGEPEKSLQYYAVSYFLWALDARKLGTDESAQGYYQAKQLDECGKLCGYSFDELTCKIQESIVNANPFDLATGYNVKYAINLLQKNLGVR